MIPLLAQLDLLLLHQVLHRLINPVQFVVLSDDHERQLLDQLTVLISLIGTLLLLALLVVAGGL